MLNDNIKMTLKEIDWSGMDLFHLAQNKGPVAVSCEQSNEHFNATKFGKLLSG
jgi:hypothetical protein